MYWDEDRIKQRLLETVERKAPIGWYLLEQEVPIDPKFYPLGTRMMYFIRQYCSEGLLAGSEDTSYTLTEAGRQELARLSDTA